MNFLQLAKRLCRECGVSSDNMTTVVGQSGEALRMIEWANAAYLDILGAHQDWGFLRTSTSFTTVAAQASYTPAQAGTTNFGKWICDSFRNYPTATGTSAEIEMDEIEYEVWRARYQFGSSRTSYSQPSEFCITPAKAIGLGPVPPAGYTVTADYFTCPVEMTVADASTHVIPTHYELIIIYRAMMMYGEFESAPEVFSKGEREYKRLMRRMEADYLPEFGMSGPLV